MRLLLAVVLAGSPGGPSDRPAILELMRQQPDPECDTGNPWLNFASATHTAATNNELMAMAVDSSLSREQQGYAYAALTSQAQPAVVDFLRKHLADAPAGSRARRLIALGLVEHGTSADVDRVVALLPGDVELTLAVLMTFNQERIPLSPASAAAVSSVVNASTDASVRKQGLRFLARSEPKGSALKQALASKDPVILDSVLFELPPEADQNLVIAALAVADRYGRERAERWLVQHVAAALHRKGGAAIGDELAKEWVSEKRRQGLGRAPRLAYLLATRVQERAQLAQAEQLYRAALVAVNGLLAEPGGPNDSRRDKVTRATGVAVRAQLALLLLQRGQRAEATALAAEVAGSREDFDEAETLVENDTFDHGLPLQSIFGFEQEFAERSKGKP